MLFIKGFYSRPFQNMLCSLGRFSSSKLAQQRMKVINFYERYGEKATKEAFGALNYKRLNSRNMKDFYKRFKSVYPCIIKSWQTDGGSKNLEEFDDELKADYMIFYNT